jgi:hypothetical protein
LTSAFNKSRGDDMASFESAGTMITNWLESRFFRVPGSSRPFLSRVSICGKSAEKKISAGAPSSICRANPLDGPKLNFTVCLAFN